MLCKGRVTGRKDKVEKEYIDLVIACLVTELQNVYARDK